MGLMLYSFFPYHHPLTMASCVTHTSAPILLQVLLDNQNKAAEPSTKTLNMVFTSSL